MKIKLALTTNNEGKVVSLKHDGFKEERKVSPSYSYSISEAKKATASYAKIDESIMKRKFSI